MEGFLKGWENLSLDELAARIAALPQENRDGVAEEAFSFTAPAKWIPTPGPQNDAYYSKADVMLYGGEAAGGKTDLILGLAMTAHSQTLIMRQQFNDLDALTRRAVKINATEKGFNGSNPPSLKTTDGRFIQFSGARKEQWQGASFDLKCWDEAVQIEEDVIRFHLGWLRSAEPSQRTRAVLATNPPTSSVGDWIIPMFAPWLDLTHPNPAEIGELRWFVSDPDGHDVEVPGPDPYLFPGQERPQRPMSRTFIRARLQDNPYLVHTDYGSRLDQLPEPYRSAVRDGNFMAYRKDQEAQVIPMGWIKDAQVRWAADHGDELQMTAIGCDVGQGGNDRVVFAPRHGYWFAKPTVFPGKKCPDGPSQSAELARIRRDGAAVVVDVGGGYGGDLCSVLNGNGTSVVRFNGSTPSIARAKDGTNRIFTNKRAQAWWRFREGLNPDQPGGSIIELPPDPAIAAELAAPTFVPDILKIQVEDKKDIKKRLGRSPDIADAIVMAYDPGDQGQKRARYGSQGWDGPTSGRPDRANLGFSDLKKDYR